MNWVAVCRTDEVAAEEAGSFEVADRRLCVINDGENWFAIDDLCNHGQAFLSEGYCDVEDCVIECPLHGGLFDYRDGSPKGPPVDKPMRTYAVRIEGDQVMVQL